MTKALITGAGGFVGACLRDELSQNGWQVTTTDILGNVDIRLDLLDAEAVLAHMLQHRYDAIFHLAGFSSVRGSWEAPKRAFSLNVFPTIHLLDALHQVGGESRMLVVGSSEQYGRLPEGLELVDEQVPRNPQNPYAISKNAQEQMALALSAKYNLDVLYTRSFNHIGPGQAKGFVVSDFASSIAAIMNGAAPVVRVGNTKAYRDFTDVRDVARAYRLLVEKGARGEIYNVGSGAAVSVQEVLDTLIRLSGQEIQVEQDPEKYRPLDQPRIMCDKRKIAKHIGWNPAIPLEESLRNTLSWWVSQGSTQKMEA